LSSLYTDDKEGKWGTIEMLLNDQSLLMPLHLMPRWR